jgi:hypothetical protein
MSKLIITMLFFPLLVPISCFGHEKIYQEKWCAEQKGKTEVSLPDGTRCDCITAKNAIEIEYAKKWYEAIGQSLYYSLQTGKRAGVVLILETKKDYKYWIRLNTTIAHFKLPIDTWKIDK